MKTQIQVKVSTGPQSSFQSGHHAFSFPHYALLPDHHQQFKSIKREGKSESVPPCQMVPSPYSGHSFPFQILPQEKCVIRNNFGVFSERSLLKM